MRKIKRLLFYGVLCVGLFVAYTNAVVISKGRETIYVGPVTDIPKKSVALIFAGGMRRDGTPSVMAADRVIRGIELYKSGVVQTLVMTGDDGAFRIDEVDAMKRYAVDRGVNPIDIVIDPHGYRTYDSCYRASYEYGFSDVIAVSQAFHLPRIVYLCNAMGVSVVGVSSEYHVSRWVWLRTFVREMLARTKAWVDVSIIPPRPRYLLSS